MATQGRLAEGRALPLLPETWPLDRGTHVEQFTVMEVEISGGLKLPAAIGCN